MSLQVINGRLDLVSDLLEHDQMREEIMSALKRTTDVLRLLQKFLIGRGDADDLLALAKTVQVISQIIDLSNIPSPTSGQSPGIASSSLRQLIGRLDMDGPLKLASRILEAIDEEGLSQQHLAEEAEAVGIAELADQVIQAEEQEIKSKKRGKPDGKKTVATVEAGPDEIWIMRRRQASEFIMDPEYCSDHSQC